MNFFIKKWKKWLCIFWSDRSVDFVFLLDQRNEKKWQISQVLPYNKDKEIIYTYCGKVIQIYRT